MILSNGDIINFWNTTYIVKLNIIFNFKYPDGNNCWFKVSTKSGKKSDIVGANKDFLHWYHGRFDSDCFVFNLSDITKMIKRKNIISYEITYEEV